MGQRGSAVYVDVEIDKAELDRLCADAEEDRKMELLRKAWQLHIDSMSAAERKAILQASIDRNDGDAQQLAHRS